MRKEIIMKKIYLFFALILSTSFLIGCNNEKTEEKMNIDNDKLSIYTTVYPLQYFAERIGQDHVHVESIYPPGTDEHTFDPSQKDMIELANADLFIYIGLGLEGFVQKAEPILQKEGVELLAAGENIQFEDAAIQSSNDSNHDHHDGHSHEGNIDPHVWIDPIYAKQLAEAIMIKLNELLPDQKEEFEKNYYTLANELDQLNEKFLQMVENRNHNEFIISHGAYGYWEHRYGLKQINLAGLSSSHEPSQKELQNIIANAKESGLKYVFAEQNIGSKNIKIVQDEIGAEQLILHNLAVLTVEDIAQNRDYFSIMEDNIKALEIGLK